MFGEKMLYLRDCTIMRNLKYVICLISVFSILFSACKKTPKEDVGIGFNTDVATKAMVTGVSVLQNDASGLSVYGMREPVSGTAVMVFDNSQLVYSSGEWTYGTVKYWIPDNTYYFISLYPYSLSDYTFSSGSITASFDYTSTLPADLTNQKDVMYAYHTRNFVSGGDGSAVPLDMAHACASVTFRIRNVSNTSVAVSNIYLDGLYDNGTCTVGSSISWAQTGSVVSGSSTYPGVTNLTAIAVSASTYHNMFSDKILVVPQDVISSIKLYFTVTPDDSTPAYSRTAQLSLATAVTKWEAGKNYTYSVAITEDRIVFEVEVLDWVDDNVSLN